MSERLVHNFLSYLANTQTNRQIKSGTNINSLVEVIIFSFMSLSTESVFHVHVQGAIVPCVGTDAIKARLRLLVWSGR